MPVDSAKRAPDHAGTAPVSSHRTPTLTVQHFSFNHSTFQSWAIPPGTLIECSVRSFFLILSPSRVTRLPFTARVQREPSDSLLPLSKGVAKAALNCAHRTSTVSRARSASKEGIWPFPPNPSEAARCASTKGGLVTLPLFFE